MTPGPRPDDGGNDDKGEHPLPADDPSQRGTGDSGKQLKDQHPQLDPEQDASQRGSGTSDGIGAHPDPGPGRDGNPNWTADPKNSQRTGRVLGSLLGDKKLDRHDSFWPYLVIRAAPGDTGARPLWPPTPMWESPDILLMPAEVTGPFDRSQLVSQPVAGHSYRVFVHVWNLGRHAALGVRVRAWWVQPGFFNPTTAATYPPTMIGGAYVNLGDRTQSNCHDLVEIGTPWDVVQDNDAHECLLAVADCPGDTWSGNFDANADRHVGQHNLTIASAATDLTPLFMRLATAVPHGADLNILHGGAAADVILRVHFDAPVLQAPAADAQLPGVDVAGLGRHLGVLTHNVERQRVFVPAAALDQPPGGFAANPVAGATVAAAVQGLSPVEMRNVAVAVDPKAPRPQMLATVLAEHFRLANLNAGTLAAALGGGKDTGHLLRFVAVNAGQLVGGYSVLVSD